MRANASNFSISYNLPIGLRIDGYDCRNLAAGDATGGNFNDGYYTVSVNVTDGFLSDSTPLDRSVSPRISLKVVNPNQFVVTDQQNVEGDNSDAGPILQAVATSPDNRTLSYSAINLPGGLVIDSATGAITGTVYIGDSSRGNDGNGNYAATVRATDGTYSASATFAWNISSRITLQVDNAQQTAVTSQQNIEGDSSGTVPILTAKGTVSSGATLTYSAQNLPIGLLIDGSSGAISGTILSGAATQGDGSTNIYTTTISASDGTSKATVILSWTVAPRLTLRVEDASGNVVTAVQGIEGVDPQLQAIGSRGKNTGSSPLKYSIKNQPTGVTIDELTGAITGKIAAGAASGGPDSDGIWPTTVTVTDGTYSTSIVLNWTVTSFVAVNEIPSVVVKSVKEVPTPLLGLSGAFFWPVNFELTGDAKNVKGGVIVQKVDITWDIAEMYTKTKDVPAYRKVGLDGTVKKSGHYLPDLSGKFPTYYEVWIVPPGKAGPDAATLVPDEKLSLKYQADDVTLPPTVAANDFFFFPSPLTHLELGRLTATTGKSFKFTGQIAYYESVTEDQIKKLGFTKSNPKTGAGGLYSLELYDSRIKKQKTAIDFFTNYKERSAYTDHVLEVKWADVPDPKTGTFKRGMTVDITPKGS